MSTTPEDPRPDEGVPPVQAAQPADPAQGDTQPLTVGDTAPLPAAAQPPSADAAAPGPDSAAEPTAPAGPVVPATPAVVPPVDAGYRPPYVGQQGQPYPGQAAQQSQPYAAQTGAQSQPYPSQPYGGQPSQPYTGQPGRTGQPTQPYAGQPYAGPAYPGQQYGYGSRPNDSGQPPYAGASYPPAAHPYAAQPYVAPGAAGTVPPAPGAPRKRHAWVPVVATLVIVVLLATAAILIGTHRWHAGNASASGPQATSIATIGQGTSGTVPVAGSSVTNPNWAAVAAAVQGTVVAIDVQTSSGEALGSGVVVDSKGHVVTNNHVVDGIASGGTLKVTLSDGRIYDATVAGTDPSTDLAVVTIKNPPSDLTVAQFGDSDKVAVGDPVMAVGNPLGLSNTVTKGIVSAVNRPVTPQDPNNPASSANQPVTNAIQIDAAVNPGNSGGALFDAQGQVIGITSSIATTSSSSGSIGLGFAIPVNLVKNIAQQLIDHGSAQHAYLGVSLTSATATADGVTRLGAQVKEVTAGSPAAAAGLQVNDVIVAINGQPVGSSDALAAYVRAMASGDKASLILVRGGKSLTVDVTLAMRPDSSSQGSTNQGSTNQGSTNQGSTNQGSTNQGSTNQGSTNQNGSGALPGNLQNMTPNQLWQWLQQHQQGQGSTSGGTQG